MENRISEKRREQEVISGMIKKYASTEVVHGETVVVKPVPEYVQETGDDESETMRTALDPRALLWRRSKQEVDLDCFAELAEREPSIGGVPIRFLRKAMPYPTVDLAGDAVSVEKKKIETRNGITTIFVMTPVENGGCANSEESRETRNSESTETVSRPILMFYHGGAFFAGSTSACINFCKKVAQLANAIVVGVEYRLAPEHYYPAGLHDCYDAMTYMYKNAARFGGDREKISVGGDSAGGTLAIGVSMLDRLAVESGEIPHPRVSAQILLYPAVLIDNVRTEDYRWRLADYNIDPEDIPALGAALSLKPITAEMPRIYMGKDGSVTDPLAAPLCAENLCGMPKTLLAICEFDYLRLQEEAFLRKLRKDGVEVRALLYRGMDHEFINRIGHCPQALELAEEVAEFLKNK